MFVLTNRDLSYDCLPLKETRFVRGGKEGSFSNLELGACFGALHDERTFI